MSNQTQIFQVQKFKNLDLRLHLPSSPDAERVATYLDFGIWTYQSMAKKISKACFFVLKIIKGEKDDQKS